MLARLGFVASVLSENISTSRTCRLRNATAERIRELIAANLGALDQVTSFLERLHICTGATTDLRKTRIGKKR